MKTKTITLTPTQREAVEHDGPLCVTAGAGSGKTLIIAERVAHMLETCDPLEVLVVAFSVKAAREMKERLAARVGAEAVSSMTVATLHALGLRMLRSHGDLLGYRLDARRRQPAVVTGSDRESILKRAAETAARSLTASGHSAAADLIARMGVDEINGPIRDAKSRGLSDISGQSAPAQALNACYQAYKVALLERNLVDFDDLVLQPLMLLRESTAALEFYQQRWTHVLVDEFQDISAAQYEIIRTISGHGNLTVVGDPQQSIYAFRGAMGAEGFNRFMRDFPAARAVYLPHNFRCAERIVRAADALLTGQKPSQEAVLPGGEVALVRAGSEHDEAQLIAGEISRALRTGFVTPAEIAVLCRTTAQFSAIERALLREEVPYTIVGQGAFFERREVRDIQAYLSLSQDWMGDPLALRRVLNVPPRGIDAEAIRILKGDDPELTVEHLLDSERVGMLPEGAQQGVRALLDDLRALAGIADRPPTEVIEHIMVGMGYGEYLSAMPDGKQRVERARALWRMARQCATVQEFLDDLDVMSGQDPLTPQGGHSRVQVMTCHDSKGLEFPVVFLVGAEDGLLPHYLSQQSAAAMDEERRLMYVALTRAQQVIYITYARMRGGRQTTPSRFFSALAGQEIRRRGPDWAALAKETHVVG